MAASAKRPCITSEASWPTAFHVQQLLRAKRVQTAVCFVQDGKITRNAEARVLRGREILHQGRISSLKHLKENVTEVKKDYECGISVGGFTGFQPGDTIEVFVREKVQPV